MLRSIAPADPANQATSAQGSSPAWGRRGHPQIAPGVGAMLNLGTATGGSEAEELGPDAARPQRDGGPGSASCVSLPPQPPPCGRAWLPAGCRGGPAPTSQRTRSWDSCHRGPGGGASCWEGESRREIGSGGWLRRRTTGWVRAFEAQCGSLAQYGRKHMWSFANICNARILPEAVSKVAAQARMCWCRGRYIPPHSSTV
ncbi:unnamed protein product [Urochloa humidicola]